MDDALTITERAAEALSDCRRGKKLRDLPTELFCQSVFGRRAPHEDVNDAYRVAHDPAMDALWSIGRTSTAPLPRPARWAVSRRRG